MAGVMASAPSAVITHCQRLNRTQPLLANTTLPAPERWLPPLMPAVLGVRTLRGHDAY
ncbi:hypothetical protein [Sodalis glossinidius]|uniref:hypothetical protein n=1 Tax=Sodalis glossinidius TaxID=63612 RepID=UPI0003254B96|nr:hypothetical protein [Sodalis glossinidius]